VGRQVAQALWDRELVGSRSAPEAPARPYVWRGRNSAGTVIHTRAPRRRCARRPSVGSETRCG